jgi:cardiolipin synthase
MLDAIHGAQCSVTIEAYIYWKGDIGMRFARALADRARAGVKVKILLDAVGSSSIGKEILEVLQSADCEVAWYNPVQWHTVGRYNNRTHRKSLIIDGRIAFTGGAGIADHWSGCAQDPKHWRDLEVRIDGPGAVPLQTGFAQNWLHTTGELIIGPSFSFDQAEWTHCRTNRSQFPGGRIVGRARSSLPGDRVRADQAVHRQCILHSGQHRR